MLTRPTKLSDGPNRQYDVGNYTLEFKKSALKDVGFKYRESGLVVQALKVLAQERVDSPRCANNWMKQCASGC